MSELASPSSAGALLRQAREAAGLPLDTLATLLKVPVPKLEALEQDRYDELPGIAFVRALAQTVCRQLHVDAAPVLALLPSTQQDPQPLENVTRGLATRFHEPASRGIPGAGLLPDGWPAWLRPSIVVSAILVVLALAFWFVPTGRKLLDPVTAVAPSEAASAVPTSMLGTVLETVADAASSVVETVHSAPEVAEPAASAASAPAAGPVLLRTKAESWVEVRDAAGAVLLSRMLLPGETVGVDGQLPLRLKIGNADGTQLVFHNQPVDLAPYTRDNVARVDLK